jgi:exodeoxyribonuclease-3
MTSQLCCRTRGDDGGDLIPAHEDSDLEYQRNPRPHRQRDALAGRRATGHRLPAKSSRPRALRSRLRRPATTWRRSAEGFRRGNPVQRRGEVERGQRGNDDRRSSSRRGFRCRAALRVASIYLPNGNPVGSDKYHYKLNWLARLDEWTQAALPTEEPLILAGDYNIIPEPADAKNPNDWVNDALFQPETRGAWRRLVNLGLTDAVRACHDGPGDYTFWDYQAGAWQKNNGIRIDHILLSPQAADRLRSSAIDKRTRSWEKPSDHVPVIIEMDL